MLVRPAVSLLISGSSLSPGLMGRLQGRPGGAIQGRLPWRLKQFTGAAGPGDPCSQFNLGVHARPALASAGLHGGLSGTVSPLTKVMRKRSATSLPVPEAQGVPWTIPRLSSGSSFRGRPGRRAGSALLGLLIKRVSAFHGTSTRRSMVRLRPARIR